MRWSATGLYIYYYPLVSDTDALLAAAVAAAVGNDGPEFRGSLECELHNGNSVNYQKYNAIY